MASVEEEPLAERETELEAVESEAGLGTAESACPRPVSPADKDARGPAAVFDPSELVK